MAQQKHTILKSRSSAYCPLIPCKCHFMDIECLERHTVLRTIQRMLGLLLIEVILNVFNDVFICLFSVGFLAGPGTVSAGELEVFLLITKTNIQCQGVHGVSCVKHLSCVRRGTHAQLWTSCSFQYSVLKHIEVVYFSIHTLQVISWHGFLHHGTIRWVCMFIHLDLSMTF